MSIPRTLIFAYLPLAVGISAISLFGRLFVLAIAPPDFFCLENQ